jgi:hypothetical protein
MQRCQSYEHCRGYEHCPGIQTPRDVSVVAWEAVLDQLSTVLSALTLYHSHGNSPTGRSLPCTPKEERKIMGHVTRFRGPQAPGDAVAPRGGAGSAGLCRFADL